MRRCAPTHWIARSLERRPVIVKTGHERRAVLVRYVSAGRNFIWERRGHLTFCGRSFSWAPWRPPCEPPIVL
jgi:hypothetical protein